jgi:cytochrome c-type biogenesis protein
VSRGVGLLAAYSLGLAVPFVIAAVAIERFVELFNAMKRGMVWMSRISGAMLVVMAVLMITGYLTVITGVLQGWTPAAIRNLL